MDGIGNETAENWGPFEQPLFADEKGRALRRIGVLDVGSNSVRLVVFDGAARSPAYFYNEKIMCGLGRELTETGRLSPDGRSRAMSAIRRFQLIANAMGISPLAAVATAAMREAEDGAEFQAEIEKETGLRLWVIGGDEEARLSAQGVLLGWPGAYGLVCDIGGSSMELAELRDGRVGKRGSTKLGPLALRALSKSKKGLSKHIRSTIRNLMGRLGPQHDRLFLVGGSWRAIARIDMERRGYPLRVLHEYRMSRASVAKTVEFIAQSDLEALRMATGIGEARMDLIPLASEVLRHLVDIIEPHDIAVSSYGIREGMLYEQMPQSVRERDPLIEACRFSEAKDARIPGFGAQLYRFILPLFDREEKEMLRLVEAGCLLHDVSWRAHPDYRHEVTFEAATRAHLGGMTHQDRVFLGLALLHRYKNSRNGTQIEELLTLLDDELIHKAEVLGKAMRFGAMLSVQTPELMGSIRWSDDRSTIQMHLAEGAEDLFGEVVEARFNALASAIGAESVVIHPG